MPEKKTSSVLRAITKDGSARAFVIDSTAIVNEAIRIHMPSPTATAALGRTLSAASILGTMLKNKTDSVILQIKGDGPLQGVLAVADRAGNVRGYVGNPAADVPKKANGKLNVGAAVGHGTLSIVRDAGENKPYIGMTALQSGEIAEDLSAYFAQSEQIPTLCALGVLVNPDHSCAGAGGVLIQLLPYATEETVTQLEENAKNLANLSSLIAGGKTTREILQLALADIDFEILDEIPVAYQCPCSRARTERALISLGKDEVEKLAAEQDPIEDCCHFCDKKYRFSAQQCRALFQK